MTIYAIDEYAHCPYYFVKCFSRHWRVCDDDGARESLS